MSLLSIINNACARLSLPRVTSVVNSTNKTAQVMLSLAQQEGRELSRMGTWKALTNEQTFTTTAAVAQTGAIPADLDWIIPETIFDRTLKRRVDGPLDAREWQQLEATLATRVFAAFRIRGASWLMIPTPSAGNTIAYEYITKNFCTSAAGAAQSVWTADTDLPVLDDELHTLGLIWRFRRMSGFSFADDFSDYQKQILQQFMREGSRPRISTDPDGKLQHGADAIAGTRPNMLLTEGGDFLEWD